MKLFIKGLCYGVIGSTLAACAINGADLGESSSGRQVIRSIAASDSTVSISGYKPFVYVIRRDYHDSLPPQLVVLLKDTELGMYKEPMTVNQGPIKEIVPVRVKGGGEWGTELHIGFDRYVDYEVETKENNLVIQLKGIEGARPEKVILRPNPAPGTQTSPETASIPKSPGFQEDRPEASLPPSESQGEYEEGYVIGPEDVLEIMVWKNQDLSRVVTVRPDGNISLPLVGDLQAAGLTPKELRDEVVAMVSKYQMVPGVSVIVKEVNSYNFYIMGEVKSPGKYQLKSNATILQAISLAGGFTPYASKNDIKVLRKEQGSSRETMLKIRYKDIVSNEDPSKNVILKPGDTIIIP
jgi:polysaccharide export outer membrane protein